jgi:hypothetical protein
MPEFSNPGHSCPEIYIRLKKKVIRD